jgi:hypothetical protein
MVVLRIMCRHGMDSVRGGSFRVTVFEKPLRQTVHSL